MEFDNFWKGWTRGWKKSLAYPVFGINIEIAGIDVFYFNLTEYYISLCILNFYWGFRWRYRWGGDEDFDE